MYTCSKFIEYLENLGFENFESFEESDSDSLDSEAPKIQYLYDGGDIKVDIYPSLLSPLIKFEICPLVGIK